MGDLRGIGRKMKGDIQDIAGDIKMKSKDPRTKISGMGEKIKAKTNKAIGNMNMRDVDRDYDDNDRII